MSLNLPTIYLLWGTALLAYILLHIVKFYNVSYGLRGIPTIGSSPSSILSFYANGYKFISNGRQILKEGYEKYRGSAFKVAQMSRWHVIVSGNQMVDDLRRATDDQLSFREAINENLQLKYFIEEKYSRSLYHIAVIRGPLTRNIGARFSEVRDEIIASFGDEIPIKSEWTRVPVMGSVRRIVSRTSNRLFVGLPLCRNPEFRNLNIDFTVSLAVGSQLLRVLPFFMRSFAARYFTSVPSKIDQARKMLGPMIQERLQKEQEDGKEWEGKPNDLLSWLLDEAPPAQKNVDDLAFRVLMANFAAIHTTSMTFTNALYHLAAYPEYIQPLREEIEAIVGEEGWNKTAVGKMRKLDSFLKETQRMTGIGAVAMIRKTLKDFTFSDGTTIPAGTFVSAAAYGTHHDEAKYPDADKFQGFRFAEMREASQGEALKHHMVTPNLDYLLFGHGRHACPGRFFAVNELKVMVAHLLLTYDIKFEDEGIFPSPKWFGVSIIPDSKAHVMFRARSS